MTTLRAIHRQDRDKVAAFYNRVHDMLVCPTCVERDGSSPNEDPLSARVLERILRGTVESIDEAVIGMDLPVDAKPADLCCDACGALLLDEQGAPA